MLVDWMTAGRAVPARAALALWERGLRVPGAEWLAGQIDVVHGTNFVVPPSRSAARAPLEPCRLLSDRY